MLHFHITLFPLCQRNPRIPSSVLFRLRAAPYDYGGKWEWGTHRRRETLVTKTSGVSYGILMTNSENILVTYMTSSSVRTIHESFNDGQCTYFSYGVRGFSTGSGQTTKQINKILVVVLVDNFSRMVRQKMSKRTRVSERIKETKFSFY